MMNRKIATVLFMLFLASTSICYASYRIYSNTVKDVVQEYFFGTLVADNIDGALYSNMTLLGTLYYGELAAQSKTVLLLRSPDNATWTTIGSTTTNTLGNFYFTINRTDVGTWYYKTGFDTP